MTRRTMTDEEFDEYFDNGGDTTEFMVGEIRQPGKADRRVNITMPAWLIAECDAEAKRLATSRQGVINTRLADYFDAKRERAAIA